MIEYNFITGGVLGFLISLFYVFFGLYALTTIDNLFSQAFDKWVKDKLWRVIVGLLLWPGVFLFFAGAGLYKAQRDKIKVILNHGQG